MPPEPTPEMIAAVAVQTEPASQADYELARQAAQIVPMSDHLDVPDILAELVRDYRAFMSAAPRGMEG